MNGIISEVQLWKKNLILVLTSGKFPEALGSRIGTGSIFCLSFSLSNRVSYQFFFLQALWDIWKNYVKKRFSKWCDLFKWEYPVFSLWNYDSFRALFCRLNVELIWRKKNSRGWSSKGYYFLSIFSRKLFPCHIINTIYWSNYLVALPLHLCDLKNTFRLPNFEKISSLQSRAGKYRVSQGNPCNDNRIPAMRTGFPVMKTGFSLWELTYREFPISLTWFGFAV